MLADKEQTITSVKDTFTIPPADLLESPEHFLLLIDLPGVPKERLDIKVRDGQLSIMGTPEPTRTKGGRLLYGEVKHKAFQRNFRLSQDVVDIDNATAHLENGVLFMNLPKRKKKPARRIPVRKKQ